MDILLLLVLSFDTFFACIALGAKKIKIPLLSKLIIAFVSSFFLAISLVFGNFISLYISSKTLNIASFIVLFSLGLFNIFDSIVKKFIKEHIRLTHSVNIKYFTLTLSIYMDKTNADKDKSLSLNTCEALLLSVMLSLDSLFTGFSIHTDLKTTVFLILLSLLLGIICSILGIHLGKKLYSEKKDYSYISGIILIFLSINKLI